MSSSTSHMFKAILHSEQLTAFKISALKNNSRHSLQSHEMPNT
jgi:hypothetical protein